MRLTLRALLAYLYNVLEPAEADEFAAKVQESPVASGLVPSASPACRSARVFFTQSAICPCQLASPVGGRAARISGSTASKRCTGR